MIDSNCFDLTMSNIVGINSNVENIAVGNLAFGHVAIVIVVVQFATIKAQVALWKLHHNSSICWGFFVVNDNVLIDIVNPQMLRCIICRSEQANENVLIESCYILRKWLIKYNKCNGWQIVRILSCLLPRRNNLPKWFLYIIFNNQQRKRLELLTVQSPIILGLQILTNSMININKNFLNI